MRSRSRISGGGSIEHIGKDIKPVHDDAEHVMPLTALLVGDEGEIVEMRGGRGMLQRLSDMGFTLSTRVKVLASCPPGPMLINVRDARIALGRGVAMKIMVRGRGKAR